MSRHVQIAISTQARLSLESTKHCLAVTTFSTQIISHQVRSQNRFRRRTSNKDNDSYRYYKGFKKILLNLRLSRAEKPTNSYNLQAK
jgi:hypothetical protein